MSSLVSVVVISFNSSKTIVETLDSIKNQTYKNVELIIADDCSKDKTVEIAKKWKEENSQCGLVNITIVANEKNLGTCGNLNSGIRVSNGKWIKILAADDLLVPEACEEFVNFAEKQNVEFVLSDVKVFPENKIAEKAYEDFFETAFDSLKKKQRNILSKNTYPGPAYFFSRELYDTVGGFNTEYDLSEEWHFCFHVLLRGVDIVPLNKKLILYRFAESSVSHTKKVNKRLLKGEFNFFKKERKKQLLKKGRILTVMTQGYNYFVDYNIDNPLVWKFLHYLDLYNWYKYMWIKKQLRLEKKQGE